MPFSVSLLLYHPIEQTLFHLDAQTVKEVMKFVQATQSCELGSWPRLNNLNLVVTVMPLPTIGLPSSAFVFVFFLAFKCYTHTGVKTTILSAFLRKRKQGSLTL